MRMFGGRARAGLVPLAVAAAVFAVGCIGESGGDGAGSAPILGPPPAAEMVAGRTLVKAGVAVAFTLEVDGLAPETWAWDFGDGEGVEGEAVPSVSHAFRAAGTYTVTATATDSSGDSVSASVTVEVTPAGGAPVLTVESVELHGTVADATSCSVTVNNTGPVALDAGEFTWRGDLDASPADYDVRAVDEGGNVTTRTVTVTLVD